LQFRGVSTAAIQQEQFFRRRLPLFGNSREFADEAVEIIKFLFSTSANQARYACIIADRRN